MKKAIINVTKHSTDTWENTEVRLFGLLVFKKHETFSDDRPRKVGFDVIPSDNTGIVEDDYDYDE